MIIKTETTFPYKAYFRRPYKSLPKGDYVVCPQCRCKIKPLMLGEIKECWKCGLILEHCKDILIVQPSDKMSFPLKWPELQRDLVFLIIGLVIGAGSIGFIIGAFLWPFLKRF